MSANPPQLFICGHSHILKVQFDKKYNLLHMNPGAAGISGFHQIRTMLRFVIDGDKIKDLEIVEISKR
jgi:predicted phosphodiesterase